MSARAPAGMASSISGKLSAASMSATSDGDDDSSVMSQPAPTSCIQLPMFEISVAIQRLRKSALCSGLQAERSAAEVAGGAGGAAGVVLKTSAGLFPTVSRRPRGARSSELQHQRVDIAPAPILSGLDGSNDRMPRRPEVLGGVLVLRLVAA